MCICIYTYICILFQIRFHYKLLQDIEYSSLCYTVCSPQLSILYIVSIVYMCQSQSPNSSYPTPFPLHIHPHPYICSEVDGPRVCHTEWSKSGKEKNISYISAYTWNLEKWYRWSYLQSKNRDTDVENNYMDTKGEGDGGRNWEIGIDTYTLLILCIK